MLAGAVRRVAGLRDQAAGGRNVDNVAVALFHHDLIRVDRPIDDAEQVYAQHAVPLFHGEVARIAADKDRRVVEDVIEASEFGDRRFNQACNACLLRNVNLYRASWCAALCNTGSHLFGGMVVDVRDDDDRPPTRQLFTKGLSQTHTATGDDRDFVLKRFHPAIYDTDMYRYCPSGGSPDATGAIKYYEATASLSAIRHTPVANGAVPTSIEL